MTRLTHIVTALALSAAFMSAACDGDLDRTMTHGLTIEDDVTFMPSTPGGSIWADEATASGAVAGDPAKLPEALDEAFQAGHEGDDEAGDVPAAQPQPETEVLTDDSPQGPLATPSSNWDPSTSETAPVYAESCRLATGDTLQMESNGTADDTFYFTPHTTPLALLELAVADANGVQVAADLQLLPVDGGASWRRARGAIVWSENGFERTGDVVDGTICFDSAPGGDDHDRAAEFSLIVRTSAGDLFSVGGSVAIPSAAISADGIIDADASLDIDLR